MNTAIEEISQSAPDSVLLLINTFGIVSSPAVINLFKMTTSATKKYVRKTAMLGITTSRRKIMKTVENAAEHLVMAFEEENPAKNWLIKP